MELRIKN